MANALRLKVVDGHGNSRKAPEHWAEADWTPMGFVPVPGTLNLRGNNVDAVHQWPGAVRATPGGIERVYHPMRVADIDCYGLSTGDHLEVLAPVHLRTELGLENGAEVTVERAA